MISKHRVAIILLPDFINIVNSKFIKNFKPVYEDINIKTFIFQLSLDDIFNIRI
jgi:hypothetical protein